MSGLGASLVFLDTSYLVALGSPRDQLRPVAAAWTARRLRPLVTTEYVLVETLNALRDVPLRTEATGLIARLRRNPDLEIVPASDELFDAGLALYAARPDKPWSVTDCISFHLMTERGLKRALTHDHHFAQAKFVPLLRQDP